MDPGARREGLVRCITTDVCFLSICRICPQEKVFGDESLVVRGVEERGEPDC
jgi:hypothetical protein